MIIAMHDLFGTSVLAGATVGAQAMAKLIAATADREATVIYLDFSNIEAATGSFIRECVLGFRDYCRRIRSNIYPVIANAHPVVEEEFRDLLIGTNDAFVSCRLSKSGKVNSAKVIGRLEQRQIETLKAVVHAGEADTSMLSKSGDDVGPTAWSNRLAGLVNKGLLMERKTGRQKVYSPVIKGMSYGA